MEFHDAHPAHTDVWTVSQDVIVESSTGRVFVLFVDSPQGVVQELSGVFASALTAAVNNGGIDYKSLSHHLGCQDDAAKSMLSALAEISVLHRAS